MRTQNSLGDNLGCIFVILVFAIPAIGILYYENEEKIKHKEIVETRANKPVAYTTYKLYMLGGHTKYHTIKHKEGDCIKPVLYNCNGFVSVEFELCNDPKITFGEVLNVVDFEKVNTKLTNKK